MEFVVMQRGRNASGKIVWFALPLHALEGGRSQGPAVIRSRRCRPLPVPCRRQRLH